MCHTTTEKSLFDYIFACDCDCFILFALCIIIYACQIDCFESMRTRQVEEFTVSTLNLSGFFVVYHLPCYCFVTVIVKELS